MATLDFARLKMDAEFDGTTVDGVFEMAGNIRVTERMQMDYQFASAGTQINSTVQSVVGDLHLRRGIFMDLGGGRHVWELDFLDWPNAVDQEGNELQWGDGSGSMPQDATGKEPLAKMQTFHNYLRRGKISSTDPATLEIGEYAPGGDIKESADVVIRQPSFSHAAEDYQTHDGSMVLIEAERLESVIFAKERLPW